MNIIETLEKEQLRNDIPEFRPGDTVRVHVKVVEGKNERIQMYEGVVIHSPRLEKIEVRRRGIVRRAKLFYLRGLSGKAARIKERK